MSTDTTETTDSSKSSKSPRSSKTAQASWTGDAGSVRKNWTLRRRPDARGKRRRFPWLRLVIPVVLIIVWWSVTRPGGVDPFFLPSPNDIWDSFTSLKGQLGRAILESATMAIGGFAIGAAIGIALGLVMAYSKVVRELFVVILDLLRPVPVFALIPLFILWFGIGRTPQVTLIALGTSVVLGVTTLNAIANVADVHVKAAMTLGASRWDIYRTVVVPSIIPHLMGAIRVAAAASWGLDVAAEFIGSQSGLGYLMINRQSFLDTSGIMLIVIIYSLLAVIFDRVITALAVPLLRWTGRASGSSAVSAVLGVG